MARAGYQPVSVCGQGAAMVAERQSIANSAAEMDNPIVGDWKRDR
jgi:hypothetical protein